MAASDKTKRKLADAFIRLIDRSSMKKIHIADICKEADVERRTFYYHFQDKYDLAAWIYDEAFRKSFYDFEWAEEIDAEQLKAQSYKFAKSILEEPQRSYYRKLFDDNSQNSVLTYMKKTGMKYHRDVAKEYLRVEKLSDAQEIAIAYYTNALNGLAIDIMAGVVQATAAQYVEYQYRMIPDFLLEAVVEHINKHRGL